MGMRAPKDDQRSDRGDGSSEFGPLTDADFLQSDCDFLQTARAEPEPALAALDAYAATIARWGAQALVNRYPDASPYKGRKGVLACEHELARHVAHLRSAIGTADRAAFAVYARWIAAVLAARRAPSGHLAASIEVLSEALRRFLPWPHGDNSAAILRDAFAHEPALHG